MQIRDLRYIFGYQKIVKVDDKLLRGSAAFTPVRAARLKLNGVQQVIDLRSGSHRGVSLMQSFEKFYCKIFNIKYVNIPLLFSAKSIPDEKSFQKVVNTLGENNLKTFIHCHFGKHRTGTCNALYQKQKKCNEEGIINGLLDCGWNEKVDFKQNSYHSLLLFLKKYFPNKKNFEIVEKYRRSFE